MTHKKLVNKSAFPHTNIYLNALCIPVGMVVPESKVYKYPLQSHATRWTHGGCKEINVHYR